ncbi:cobalamin biosynthesis protein [Nocardia sp. NPDC006630]|uniref:cobalamin biosynthesis protein n=1 Tax=Nocardia sp. NPDC006630 TaxID=3157181 RepID=UPI0033B9C55A
MSERQCGPAAHQLAVGVGMRSGVAAEAIVDAIREVLGDMAIGCLATVDRRSAEPGLVAAAEQLGVPLVVFTAAQLASVAVPSPSVRTAAAIGTPSVAEAAAVLAAGNGELVIRKRVVGGLTVAAATIRR